jgi:hypothetical protein
VSAPGVPPASHRVTGPSPGARRGLAGAGLLAVWIRVRPRDEDDLNRWYATEHLPERLDVPGFLGARRYLDPVDRTYLALYELASPEVITAPGYQERFTRPTDWTRRVLGSFQWSRRRVYRLAATRGDGIGGCAGALILPGRDHAAEPAGRPDEALPGGARSGEALTDEALLDAALSGAPGPGPGNREPGNREPGNREPGLTPGLTAAHLLVADEDRLLLLEGTTDTVAARVAVLTGRLGLTPGQDTCVAGLLHCV